MKLLDLFESAKYTLEQEFIIRSWGQVLYLDYFDLPAGRSTIGTYDLAVLVREYNEAIKSGDEDKITELDEWIAEGAPLKNGKHVLTKETVDVLLTRAQHKAGKEITLYRFDERDNPLKPDAWISMTTKDNGYAGARREYHLKADDLIIDAHGLADDQEVIVNTNVLLKSTNEAYQPEWEKPCWIVAIKNTLGVSEEKIKELALKHDWDGKSDGLAVKNVIMIVWDLIGHMPDLSLTKDSRGMTPKEFSGTQGKTGLVFTKAHVMPMINGKVSNFNGHGEEEIAAVATYKGKK